MSPVRSPKSRNAARIPNRPAEAPASPAARGWWLLVHQLPPRPPGLRMRIWRRLQALGAQQVKGSVYVLPATPATREDLTWLVHEIRAVPAEASLWHAQAIEGLDDATLVEWFRRAAEREYTALARELRPIAASRAKRRTELPPASVRALARLRARFEEAIVRDAFEAPGRDTVAALLDAAGRARNPDGAPAPLDRSAFRGRTWATRAGVRVDRMASAWLIRRHVDPDARFVFTDGSRGAPSGAIRFDTYGGEFTHEAERCTFEVLLRRFGLRDRALARLGEIVHDIDLKESRYAHPETAGISASLDAIVSSTPDDVARIEIASAIFDGLVKRHAGAGR